MTFYLTREEIAQTFPTRRAQQRFEALQQSVAVTGETVTANVDSTQKISEATYVTLSPNGELPNERVLQVGGGLSISADTGSVTLSVNSSVVRSTGGFSVTLTASGDTNLAMPLSGFLTTRDSVDTLQNKTLQNPSVSGLGNYADDAAASAGGVPVGGVYRNGSQLMIRVA